MNQTKKLDFCSEQRGNSKYIDSEGHQHRSKVHLTELSQDFTKQDSKRTNTHNKESRKLLILPRKGVNQR